MEQTNKRSVFDKVTLLRKGFCSIFIGVLDDFVLRILILSSLVSLVIDMIFEENKKTAWIEGAAIMFAVLIVAFVTAWNDYQKEKQFISLYQF